MKMFHQIVSNMKDVIVKNLNNTGLKRIKKTIYYKRKGVENGDNKDTVTEEIIKVTDKIKNVKRELFYCEDIVERTNKMVENIKFIEEEKWNKQNEKEQKIDKNLCSK